LHSATNEKRAHAEQVPVFLWFHSDDIYSSLARLDF
jgi:hypothetical protein